MAHFLSGSDRGTAGALTGQKPVDMTVGETTVWSGEGVCGVGRYDQEATGLDQVLEAS